MGSVLIVDDEQSLRFTLEAFIRSEGHSAFLADDMASAIALVRESPIDIVVADIVLSGSSGLDLLKTIRQIAPDTRVIMMTGEPTLDTAAEALRLGAFDYLQKPVLKTQFLSAIRNAFNARRIAEEENLEYTIRLEKLVGERTRALARSEATLRRRARELAVLHNLSREVGASITVNATIEAGLNKIALATGSDLVVLFLRHEDHLIQRGYFAGLRGIEWDHASGARLGECLRGIAFNEDRPVYCEDIPADSRCTLNVCKDAGFGSLAAFPLRTGKEAMGILGLLSIEKRDFKAESAFLLAVASEMSIGLKKSLLYEQLQHRASELQASLEKIRSAEADRLQLQTQLQQSQKMEAIGTLAGGIAHDFNNILGAVIGYAELAQNHIERHCKAYAHLNEVISAGVRAKNLIQQILTFSREAKHSLSPIRLEPVATEALRMIRASLPSTIEIRQTFSSQLAVVADPTRFHQVLMNLCTNAAHAMRKRGGLLKVSISDFFLNPESASNTAVSPGTYVKLTVTDTGHGMSRHTMDRIFDPFFSTKRKDEGTGLGLSVVHRIIKNLNGHILVRSKPGKGTLFEVLLPAVDAEVETYPEPQPIPTGTEHILLVDDEKPLVQSLKLQLESLGYRVTAMTCPLEALDAFREAPSQCDLVITDLTMPQLPGDRLAKALLEIRPDLPILLCTGFSTSMDSKSLAAAGFRALLYKPVLKRQLAVAIRQALGERQPACLEDLFENAATLTARHRS
ncbi:MAG: response regulator [Desulfobacteraceae bacterium]|nr:response regulator [Desulfobacteraceae bacterium]